MEAINREIENLKFAFDILKDEAKIPVVCNKAYGHSVLDTRMMFERKSR